MGSKIAMAGTCRNCGEAVSYFARSCPACGAANQPNPVTMVVAFAVLALLMSAAGLGSWFLWKGTAGDVAEPASTGEPGAETPEAFGWIAQAMADCEVLAKQNADALYFLIVPVKPSGNQVAGWRPVTIGNLGQNAALLASADALVGLRNGALELYRDPLTFAVKDPDTNTVYKWKPANGVSELKSRELKVASLTLGIELGNSGEVLWGPTIAIAKGSCYWTNPLILPGAAR
jgi:hypothetical protein